MDNDRVQDTRTLEDGFSIRRLRVCGSCHQRFVTYERVEDYSTRVVKRDERRQPFDRNKVRLGIQKACWKRPVSGERIEAVVREVEAIVLNWGEGEVHCESIGELILERLFNIDQVAYVRFASVYRDFASIDDFFQAIERLSK